MAHDDVGLFWELLAIAAYEPDVDTAKAVPFVAAHLAEWQRPEDFGFIAELDGMAIGAIAVGMPITGHPPHRTGRAAFPHPAPTLDV
jgi:hypothetical protein